MYTLTEVAISLGLKTNKLRYWLKKNNDDCENNLYDFRLQDLLSKLSIKKKVSGRAKARNYEQYMVLDLEEFKEEYYKYTKFSDILKKQKSEYKNWSNSAMECYQHNMNCTGCPNFQICIGVINHSKYKEPPMKIFVQKLLNKNIKPPTFM